MTSGASLARREPARFRLPLAALALLAGILACGLQPREPGGPGADGTLQTLDEVIEFYDKGGGKGNTELKPLGLSDKEKKYLKAFLVEALSGETTPFEYPKVP